jgi:hypothetical protein
MPSRNIICLDVENIIYIFNHMDTPELTPELKALNKYLKKMYPFIVNVDSINYMKSRRVMNSSQFNTRAMVNVYVSPRHFCELMDNRVSRKLEINMIKETIQFFQAVVNPDVHSNNLQYIFFPDVEEVTIFDGLDV